MTDSLEATGAGRTRARYHELLLAYNNLLEEYGLLTLTNDEITELLDCGDYNY